MKAVIFGASGQDGHYLNEILVNKGYQVLGISRAGGKWISGDVSNLAYVENLIRRELPQLIFHLAANSTTRHDVLFENHETISTGTLNILESVYRHCKDCRVFLSGSAMQFRNEETPIDEYTPFEAGSPYAIARIQSTYAGRYYRSLGLKVYVGYFFNHESPLRTSKHVSRMIVDAVRNIRAGSQQKIELGDISVKKEWNFAGDFARAIFMLTTQDTHFEMVIGSGKAYSIADFLDICFEDSGLDWKNYVVLKTGFTPEYQLLVSNPSLLFSIGYQPEVDIRQLAKLMLNN